MTSKAAFADGVATAVAFARTTAQGTPTDAHQWLVELTVTIKGMLAIDNGVFLKKLKVTVPVLK